MMANNVEPGKIFVGGLSWDTTKDGLKKYFENFGEVTDSVIMIESESKKPRGFGFVTFANPNVVETVTNMSPHNLDGKKIDPKPASAKGIAVSGGGGGADMKYQQPQPIVTKKIFLGGIPNCATEDDVKRSFEELRLHDMDYKQLEVVGVDLKYEKETNRMRGFGFVEFGDETTVEQLVQKHYIQIHGKMAEMKKAESRNVVMKDAAYPPSQYAGGAASQYAKTVYGTSNNYPNYSQYLQQYYTNVAAAAAAGYPQYQQYSGAGGNSYGNAGYGGGGQQPGSGTVTGQHSGYAGQDNTYAHTPRAGYGTGTEGYGGQGSYPYDSTLHQPAAVFQQQQQQQQHQQQPTYGESQTSATYHRGGTTQMKY